MGILTEQPYQYQSSANRVPSYPFFTRCLRVLSAQQGSDKECEEQGDPTRGAGGTGNTNESPTMTRTSVFQDSQLLKYTRPNKTKHVTKCCLKKPPCPASYCNMSRRIVCCSARLQDPRKSTSQFLPKTTENNMQAVHVNR